MRSALISGVVLAGLTAGVVVVVEPRLAISGAMSRSDIWLLAVFTEAVLALLGGLSGGISRWARSKGVRDLAEGHGPDLTDPDGEVRDSEAAVWVTALGVCLLMIYAVGWVTTRP